MPSPTRPELWFDGANLRGRGNLVIPYNGVTPPPPSAAYRPVRVTLSNTSSSANILAGLQAAGLDVPTDANYVMWPYADPDGAYLDTVFATLGSNDILVLPEKLTAGGQIWEYKVDSAPGFRRAANDLRHFWSMGRFTRGVVGLGPNTVINTTASSFSMPAQPKPVGNGGAGVFDIDGKELVGCAYKILECATANPYVGNFEMRGRSFGAVAYNGITFSKGIYCLENVFFNGSWRGFSNSPNGEAGGWTNRVGAVRKARNWECEARDSTGARVGSTCVLLNSQTGAVLEDFYVHHTRAGIGVTAWTCNSTVANPFIYTRGRAEFCGGGGGGLNGAGFNYEICSGTFKVVGPGTIINNYLGNYDSSQGTGNSELHISGGSSTAKARIEVWNMAIDKGPAARNTGPGTTATGNGPFYDGTFTLAAQTFGYSPQMGLDLFRYDVDSNPLPTHVY